jgi:hypothetical protein
MGRCPTLGQTYSGSNLDHPRHHPRIIWTGVAEETNLPDTEVKRLEAIAVVEAPWGCCHESDIPLFLFSFYNWSIAHRHTTN